MGMDGEGKRVLLTGVEGSGKTGGSGSADEILCLCVCLCVGNGNGIGRSG